MLLLKIVKVAVEQTAYHFDKLYSYTVPASLNYVKRGSRVLVPFGHGNKRRQGIVVEEETTSSVEKLKPILAVLDEEPLLNEEMLGLALWLKERTFCTVFDAVRAMLPTGLYMRVKPEYRLPEQLPETVAPTIEEQLLIDLVAKHSEGIRHDALLRRAGLSADSDLPNEMVRRGLLLRTDAIGKAVGDATVRMVRLAVEPETLEERMAELRCTDKQKAVLELLCSAGAASVKEVCYFASVTQVVIQTLQKKGLVVCYEHEVLRTPYEETERKPIVSDTLNRQQQAAYDDLLALYRSHKAEASLLYGVTGSGKTRVYMNLIDRVVEDGRQVLVLVPEISLTPQTVSLFLQRYGTRVAVLHSALAMGERVDEWKRVRSGDAQIVVGTRSAVFAPFQDLGLVVLDEEQEHTYKSENAPRYHAKDVARYRCVYHKALLVFSSATPSVESYHYAKIGRYHLQSMTERYGDAALPEVQVVDLREDTLVTGVIGNKLKTEIEECLQNGKQAILLLNRRGYHTHISCRQCGYVATCPSCSISLTYHKANRQLMCHYCGHMQPYLSTCPECGSDKVRYAGLGTQLVEQELTELFPSASVLRMDTDTTMSRFAYEQKFSAFANGEYDIMIGTQMVAKGLDFPNVSLVGVLSADQSLYGDDFRSFETTFSLLTQVVGRAGRRDQQGKAVIQTYTPENYVIELAGRQDYLSFFETEIAARKMMKYPPYTDLCLFGFVGVREQEVKEAANRFLSLLHEFAVKRYPSHPIIALDPTPAAVARVSGKYRYKLLIKTVCNNVFRQMVSELLAEFNRESAARDVTLFVDINPIGMI